MQSLRERRQPTSHPMDICIVVEAAFKGTLTRSEFAFERPKHNGHHRHEFVDGPEHNEHHRHKSIDVPKHNGQFPVNGCQHTV
jgi:hypothetical protein